MTAVAQGTGHEDEVLQTRVVSNTEVWAESEWKPATLKEIKSLEDKGAIRRCRTSSRASKGVWM